MMFRALETRSRCYFCVWSLFHDILVLCNVRLLPAKYFVYSNTQNALRTHRASHIICPPLWPTHIAYTTQHPARGYRYLPCLLILSDFGPVYLLSNVLFEWSSHTFMTRAPNECVLFHWPPSEIIIVQETPCNIYDVKIFHKYSTFYYFPPQEVLKTSRSTGSWACRLRPDQTNW